ncbi:MAG TPA: bacterial transcriptional activator domain-containing protein, partial [Thermoanaerobaculia bacterium]|nr:bacterial transcriptional activator domain-containing protein [Thermoanaerobaculia bacterium]
DPGNLVSAKSLADIYLSRGEALEAIKKSKLYRAISGDRTVEGVIARLEKDLSPPPPRSAPASQAAVPPPPSFLEEPASPVPGPTAPAPEEPLSEAEGPFDLSPVSFDLPPPTVSSGGPDPFAAGPSEPAAVAGAAASPPQVVPAADVATRAFRMSEILGRPTAGAAPSPEATPEARDVEGRGGAEPQGRTLADLYFAQGHYAEALRIYDELVSANPFDEELRRLRRDAEARLLPAGSASVAGAADPVFDRRLKKIRTLRQWLSVLQAG